MLSLGRMTRRVLLNGRQRIRHPCKSPVRRSFCTQNEVNSWTTPEAMKMHRHGLGIGLVAGTAGSMLGIGGGLIVIPYLVGVLKFKQMESNATAFFVNASTCFAGAAAFAQSGAVVFPVAATVAISAGLMTRAGANIGTNLQESTLKMIYAWGLLIFAPLVLLRGWMKKLEEKEEEEEEQDAAEGFDYYTLPYYAALGGFTGFATGILGFGAGSLITTSLVLASGMTQHVAVGTSLAGLILPNVVGSYTHWRKGNVRMSIVPGLVAGCLIGGQLGGRIAMHVSEEYLRYCFSLFLFVLGARGLLK